MTNEELNKALYDKMSAEMDAYRDWLTTCSPTEILRNAYEYAMREDILLSLEYYDLDDDQARALLNMENPLRQAFNRFEKLETDHMEYVWSTLENVADEAVSPEREQSGEPDAVEKDAAEYEKAEIFGIPALFADERISAADVPEGLYRYDLRGSDNDPGRPVAVENHVGVNHAGTLITARPLDIPDSGFLLLTEENGLDFQGEACTIQQFRDEQKQERGEVKAKIGDSHETKQGRNTGKSGKKRASRER